jgi:glycerate 2-kinase
MAGIVGDVSPELVAGRAFREESWSAFSPSRILCVGKSAGGLARAAAARWPSVPGLVYSTVSEEPPEGFQFLCGEHPFPTQENVERTAQVRRWLEAGAGPLLACISGGASSLLVEPRSPWTLEDKLDVTGRLWRGGATIRELNAVRASLSSVKAGGLLESVRDCRVRTAVWSDVGSRDGVLVGSAPTIPWKPSPPPLEVAARFGVALARPLPRRRRGGPRRTEWQVIFDAAALRRRFAGRLRELGYRTSEFLQREGERAEELAARIARCWTLNAGRGLAAVVGCGEAPVAVPPGSGRGGRCSHLAAAVALELGRAGSARRWAFAAMATDGVDGVEGAGAFVEAGACPSVARLRDALRRCDTASLWAEAGGLLPAAPTGNNLRDLWVLLELEAAQ